MALEVGEVQGMENPDPVNFDRIRANKNIFLRSILGMNIGYFAMNTGYGILIIIKIACAILIQNPCKDTQIP